MAEGDGEGDAAPSVTSAEAARASAVASTDRAIASPRAVPPVGLRLAMASRTWPRSAVGATTRRASVEKAITPTRKAAGRLFTNEVAASLAAASRVGLTSVASIDLETSIVSITVASSRGTWSVIDGRASAIARNAMAPR